MIGPRPEGSGPAEFTVGFDATLADMTEVSLRVYRESRIYRRVHWTFGVATALVLGIVIGARTAAYVSGLRADLAGILAAGTSLLVYQWVGRWALHRSLRARWRRHFRAHGGLRVEVTLTADALRLRQGETEATFAWPEIAGAVQVAGAVELRAVRGLLARVPDRAFAPPAERARFIQVVNERAHAHPAAARG